MADEEKKDFGPRKRLTKPQAIGVMVAGGVMLVVPWFISAESGTTLQAGKMLVGAAGFVVLCLGNIGLATLIARAYHPVAGIVYPLLPSGLLITGFHSQFDNLAVVVGLASWLLIRPWERPTLWRWVLSGAVMGASVRVGVDLGLYSPISHRLVSFPKTQASQPTWLWVALVQKRLEHAIRSVPVELDAHFGPQFVGKLIELATRRDGHQQRLGLLVDSQFSDADCVRDHLDRTTEIQCSDDDRSAGSDRRRRHRERHGEIGTDRHKARQRVV